MKTDRVPDLGEVHSFTGQKEGRDQLSKGKCTLKDLIEEAMLELNLKWGRGDESSQVRWTERRTKRCKSMKQVDILEYTEWLEHIW